MRVLTLVPNQKGYAPGQRGSIELWEKVLEPQGIYLHYSPFESDELRRILHTSESNFKKAAEMMRCFVQRFGVLRDLDRYDAVFIYREAALLGPALLERLIARRKPIIYQLDDPLYVPYRSFSNGYLSYLKFFGKIKEIIKMSKVVMVNSSFIEEYARQFNKNVWVVPSIVDTTDYVYKPFAEKPEKVTVGWSGSPSTATNLKLIEKPLEKLAEKVEHELYLVGAKKFDLPNLKHQAQQWRAETEVSDLRKMNIGLIPLPLNEWNKRKFLMKTSQYMSLGIPPVATPLGSNTEFIKPGINGFLADTEKEWVDSLETLVRDHDLRNQMSRNAARDAQEKFSLEANASKIIKAFQALAK